MMQKQWWLRSLLMSSLVTMTAAAIAAKEPSLLDLSDQMDRIEKQDFQAAIDKANACTRARSFPCSESELAKAAKVATSAKDKKTLIASRQMLANEKQELENENRREMQARHDAAERERQEKAERERQEDREFWQRKAREREDATPTPSYVQPSLADQLRTFQNIDREAANYGASIKAAQVAAQRERDAQRNEEARQSRERQAQEDKRERENQRRKESERAARVTTAEVKNEAPRYQTPVATISTVSEKCPPGSSPARHPNGQYMTVPPSAYCIKDSQISSNQTSSQGSVTVGANGVAGATPSRRTSNNNGSTGNDERVTSNTTRAELTDPKKKNIEWGPVKSEAIAVCRQISKTNKWGCNGPFDNQIIMDEPTLESALKRQRCAGGSWTAGGPIIDGVKWEAYACGHSLGNGDFDVVKRYGMITARRSYMCPKYEPSDGRCTTIYDGQDKR